MSQDNYINLEQSARAKAEPSLSEKIKTSLDKEVMKKLVDDRQKVIQNNETVKK